MRIVECSSSSQMNEEVMRIFLHELNKALLNNRYINIGIATGRTFVDFITSFNCSNDIPFERINLFMIDEYIGVDPDDASSCAIDLISLMTSLPRIHRFYTFNKHNYLEQIKTYNSQLSVNPFDILLLGIGQDGHFAFCNHCKPFSDKTYEIVHFSREERSKQVNMGWFRSIGEVPLSGITVTSFGALHSRALIMAAKHQDKKDIIDSIIHNRICEDVAIYPLLKKEDSYFIYG